MTVKEKIEKGAEAAYYHNFGDNREWCDVHPEIQERFRTLVTEVLLTLNLINKCPECGGTDCVKHNSDDSYCQTCNTKEVACNVHIPCTCHQGYIATEDRLVEAARDLLNDAQLRSLDDKDFYYEVSKSKLDAIQQTLAERGKESE